jgi:Zn ribbon nucleic-acid-binding protein
VQVLDDSDGLFAKLTKWAASVAEDMSIPAPSVSTWVTADEAKGIRSTTPEGAYEQVRAITEWFLIRLEAVAYLDQVRVFHDDLCWGWKVGDDSQPGVFKLQGRYPLDPQPPRESETRECPICSQRTVTALWDANGDPHVFCTRCEWQAPNTDRALVKLDEPEVDPANHLLSQLADLAGARYRARSTRPVEVVVSSATLTDILEDVDSIHGMPLRVDDTITYAAAEVLWTTPRLRAVLDEYQGKEAA